MGRKRVEGLTIELPGVTPDDEIQSLASALSEVDSVEQAKARETRSIDAQTIALWVQVAAGVLTTIEKALPIVSRMIDMIRHTRITGVKLRLKDASLEVDNASADDVERFLKTANQSAKSSS